jgi:acetoacetyl-CoA synthetase
VLLMSFSGGTDVCTGFLGGSALLPVYAGEIACRCLGARIEAYDEAGRPVIGRRGELGHHRADAFDAGGVLGGRRRVALPRRVLRALPRRLAARRLDHDHRARHLHRLRPV